jgi:hypothetical protein
MAAPHQRGVMLRPWNGIPRAAAAAWVRQHSKSSMVFKVNLPHDFDPVFIG